MRFKKLGALILGALLTIGVAAGIGATVEKDRVKAADVETSVELTITGTTGALASDNNSISWTKDGVTFTNKKGSTAIRTSDSAHYRIYAGSSIEINCANGNITEFVVTCTSDSYATVLNNSIVEGAEAVVDGSIVTATLTNPMESYNIANVSAQTRVNKVVVTYNQTGGGSSEPEQPVYPTTITVSPKTASVPQGSTKQLEATIDNDATVNDVSWKSSDTTVATVDNTGLVEVQKNAGVGKTATITAYSEHNGEASDSALITVADAVPTSTTLRREGYAKYKVGQKIIDSQDGRLYIEYSNDTEKDIEITDSKLSATVDGDVFDILNDTFTKEDDGKKLLITYKDGNYVATLYSAITLQIFEDLKINTISSNFNSNSNFILSNISNKENLINIKYDCWENTANITVESSDINENVLIVGDPKNEMNNPTGTITLPVTPVDEAEGQVELTITLTRGEFRDSGRIVIPVVKGVETQTSGGSTTTTIDTTAQGYTNAEVITSINSGDITINFSKGANNNPPTYYNSGTAIRVYGGNTVTIQSTNNIVEILITFGSSDGNNTITVNTGDYSDGTWTGNATSVVFTIGGTSGNRRFQTFEITTESTSQTVIKESADFLKVNTFVNTYMHHDDIALIEEELGVCGEYFESANTEFVKLTDAQRIIFRDVFTLSYARLQAWADANNATFVIDTDGSIKTSNGINAVMAFGNETSMIIIIFAIVALSGFAFFYVAKRKNKEFEF